MNDKEFEKILSELNVRLKVKHSDFKGLYFYGSRARGKGEKYSDYDIVFIFERDVIGRKLRDEVISIVYDYEIENDIIVDIKVYPFKFIQQPITPFHQNIKTEGIFYGV